MNRRNAIKNIGLSIGSISMTPTIAALFESCQSESEWKPNFFSNNQIKVISNFLDIIIPKTNDLPSASELNLIRYIDAHAFLVIDKKNKTDVLIFIDSLINNTIKSSVKSEISKLTYNDYENQLKKFLLAEDSEINKWKNLIDNYESKLSQKEDNLILEEAMSFLATKNIREWGVRAFRFHNELIANNGMVFRPIPGNQKGCVNLEETTGGKAWY